MRLAALLILLGSFPLKFKAQEITSFYLKDVPECDCVVETFSPEEVGYYLNTSDSLKSILVKSDTIVFNSAHYAYETKSELFERGCSFKNGKLLGVVEGEGINYVESGDTIYYAFTLDRPEIILNSALTYKLDDYYVQFNSASHSLFTLVVFRFTEDVFEIWSVNHDPLIKELKSWKSINEKQVDGIKTYVTSPTLDELNKLLMNPKSVDDKQTFVRTSS